MMQSLASPVVLHAQAEGPGAENKHARLGAKLFDSP